MLLYLIFSILTNMSVNKFTSRNFYRCKNIKLLLDSFKETEKLMLHLKLEFSEPETYTQIISPLNSRDKYICENCGSKHCCLQVKIWLSDVLGELDVKKTCTNNYWQKWSDDSSLYKNSISDNSDLFTVSFSTEWKGIQNGFISG